MKENDIGKMSKGQINYVKHRERILRYQKAYYTMHKRACKTAVMEWSKAHPGRVKELFTKWRLANPEKYRANYEASNARAKARRLEAKREKEMVCTVPVREGTYVTNPDGKWLTQTKGMKYE